MAPFPTKITLPYRLDRPYLEREALDGRFPDPDQRLTIELGVLDEKLRADVLAVFDELAFVDESPYPLVHGTGIDLSAFDGDAAIDALRHITGPVPTLPEPADRVEELLDAYDDWIALARSASDPVLRDWVARNAGRVTVAIPCGDPQAGASVEIAAEDAEFELLRRALAASIRVSSVADEVGAAAMERAGEIVDLAVPGAADQTLPTIVAEYEERARRFAAVAKAHHRAHTALDVPFDDEMARWIAEHGSERLRLGLEDGYRMTPVYLEERIAVEAPGFYAARIRPGGPIGKERTGPSERALTLRRRVQERLDEHAGPGGSINLAMIRWATVEDLPDALVRESDGFAADFDGAVEAIVVPKWLGRYQLIGIVEGPDRETPWWVARTIPLEPYGLRQSAVAPVPAPADEEIPF